jgi:signal peptidase I
MLKCQNCGFQNEEADERCFQCGAILVNAPAARHRDLPLVRENAPLWWQLYRPLRRSAQLVGQFLVPREPERELPRRNQLLAAALALLPGLGQLYNHQHRKALRLLLLFVALILVNILAIMQSYSNFLLLLLGVTVVFSATDAFASATVINGSLWTPLKSLLFACYVLFMLGLFFSIMQWAILPGVQLAYVSQNVLAPTFRKGDRVVVDRLTYRVRNPKRGEIVFYKPQKFTIKATRPIGFDLTVEDQYAIHSKNNIERIVGLPGETIELRKHVVYVNGEPAAPKYSPLMTEQLAADFKLKIPDDSYCVIYSVAPVEDGPILSIYAELVMKELGVPPFNSPNVIMTDEWAKACIVHKDEIIGLIRCIYNPPERRRWL